MLLIHAPQSGFALSLFASLKSMDDFPGHVSLINQGSEVYGALAKHTELT